MARLTCVTVVVCACWSAPAAAQVVLTLEDTIARARERAGTVAIAQARIGEAEAGIVAAARLRENPVVDASAGPRFGTGVRHTELDIGVSQQFETGGQRAARLVGARAGVDRRQAEVEQVARRAIFDAASVFLEGLAAAERLAVAEQADTISRELLRVTEERYAAGDIAAIDVNLARIDAARSEAALRGARASQAGALGTLRMMLRLPAGEPVELRGSLSAAPLPALETLEAAIEERPEFRVLAADIREADAGVQLGRALSRPDVGLGVRYAREEGDPIVAGGLSVSLPFFQRGQGVLAEGLAQSARARLEVAVLRDEALAQLRTAYAVHAELTALAEALAEQATPALDDNETLGRRSYEEGEMNLMELLLIRRDALDTRMLMIERQLEARRSRLEMDFLAGVLR